MNPAPVLCVMGPTAAGKTELALHLAGRLPLDIVSVDSALVYRGLDIGTAKPDAPTLARHPHRLVDIVEPSEVYSTARFRDDALREIADIHGHGRIPLLVGGTMLYFRALTHGLSDLPPADPEVRARIEARARREGWAAMHDELARIDPDAAARIHPNDPQRIQRALEVHELTGKPISELQVKNRRSQIGSHGEDGSHGLRFHKLAVAPEDRAVLHGRIEARVIAMFAAGLVDEVRRLRARGDLDPDLPSMRAVGYRQVWAGLDAGDDEAAMVREVVFATRQLAKRQLTWLRHETGLTWLDPARNGWLDEGLAWAACANIPVPEALGKKEYGDG